MKPTTRSLTIVLLLMTACGRAGPASGALAGGPMVGISTSTSVAIWLMLDSPGRVEIEHWPLEQPDRRARSAPLQVTAEDGYTAQVHLTGLPPGIRYGYRVLLDGEPIPVATELRFVTGSHNPSPPRDLLIATASCTYIPDPPYEIPDPKAFGTGFEIFDAIAGQRPDLMLWLGDNIYYRDTDLTEDTAVRMNARWAATRTFPPIQRLLQTGQHLAIWDDHDYGPDNSDRTFALKEQSLGLFKRYWANADYGLPEVPGVFSKASMGDVDLFLLDDRYYRDDDAAPPTPESTMLGARQLEWLKRSLLESQATFRLIVNGSRMLTDKISETRRGGEGWHNFPEERATFLNWLTTEHIDGVFFVSGDIHYTHLTQRERPGTYPLTELTCSPLTTRVHPRPFPVRELPGTLVTVRNFCTLRISGPAEERLFTVSAWDAAGRELWTEAFPAASLRSP